MAYSDIKEMLQDARDFASGAHDQQTVNLLKDIQLEVYDLMDENRGLRLENEELKNIKIIESDLQRVGDFLRRKNTDDKDLYCMHCWDNDRKLIRTVSVHMYYTDYMECFKCKFYSDNFS